MRARSGVPTKESLWLGVAESMRLTEKDVKSTMDRIRSESPLPQFKTQNRPIVNLLHLFTTFYNSARDPVWVLELENCDRNPPQSGFDKDNYFTQIVSSLTLGFETYLKYALRITGYLAKRADIVTRIEKLPKGTSIVEHLFNNLPGQLHPDLSLDKTDPEAATFFRGFIRQPATAYSMETR